MLPILHPVRAQLLLLVIMSVVALLALRQNVVVMQSTVQAQEIQEQQQCHQVIIPLVVLQLQEQDNQYVKLEIIVVVE